MWGWKAWDDLKVIKWFGDWRYRLFVSSSTDVPLTSTVSSRTNFLILSPAPSQGIVLQGRHFQHAQLPTAIRKPVQR